MPAPFSQKHLRLEIPLTTDGMNLNYDENNQVRKKIVVLPYSAKRAIESNQAKKPAHLKAKITVVEGDKLPKQPVVKTDEEIENSLDNVDKTENEDAAPVADDTVEKIKKGKENKNLKG